MSWYSKVFWSEGLFLRPASFAAERPLSSSICSRNASAASRRIHGDFPSWRSTSDLAQQSKFAVRRAAGVMPDGTPFDIPADSPLPEAIDIPADAVGSGRLAVHAGGGAKHAGGRRSPSQTARAAMSAPPRPSSIPPPRFASRRKSILPIRGWRSNCARPASRVTWRSALRAFSKSATRHILFDDKFVPPLLLCAAHPVVEGWINSVIGWIENKLEELARYAVDPSSGGGLQSVDYLVLQLLNRQIPVLMHFRQSGYRSSGAPVRGIAEAGGRACDFRHVRAPRA